MRVVSWNMGMARQSHHRPGLHDQAWHYLLGLGPDLAFVQEALPPSWVRSEGALIQGPFTQWGSAIFSPRYPIERFLLPDETPLRALGSYLALGLASLPDGSDALVASVHAVDRKATKAQLGNLDPASVARTPRTHPWVSDVVFVGLDSLIRRRQFIVAGDWNTARRFGSRRSSRMAEAFFRRARGREWFECINEKSGQEMRTWFRSGSQPSQIDHAFCNHALHEKLQGVRVGTDAAEHLELSDHAPLILDFDIAPIAMTSLNDAAHKQE